MFTKTALVILVLPAILLAGVLGRPKDHRMEKDESMGSVRRVRRQILSGLDSYNHPGTETEETPADPRPQNYHQNIGPQAPCQYDIKSRCKGSGLVTTCNSVWNSETHSHTNRCYYGDNDTDISHLMTCCKNCCERSGEHDIYMWCAEMTHEDVTCLHPDDCWTLHSGGETRDGVYNIEPDSTSLRVYCDMTTAGGGWTVIQSRINGDVDFNRTWAAYEEPFGDPEGNFWIGLRNIHILTTSSSQTELYIELEDFDSNIKYARYSRFSIDDAASLYRLAIGGYRGTAGDSMTSWFNLNGKPFTTLDRDNDDRRSENCAVLYGGPWWYRSCSYSNLNGIYFPRSTHTNAGYKGITWYTFNNNYHSLKRSKMMVRRLA